VVSEDDLKLAEGLYNEGLANLRKCVPGKPGFGAEKRYAEGYQGLVRIGVKPQLKRKYRTK
jgi:hypothetical protein